MIVLIDERGREYLINEGEDLHCSHGMVRWEDIEAAGVGGVVKSNKNHGFNIIRPSILDFISKAKRGPQAMTLKDMSLACGYAGIRSGSRVLESGTGSGLFTMFLAHTVYPETVVTYELREDFANIARMNFDRFGIGNVRLEVRDIYEGVGESDLDAAFLDLAEPWRAAAALEGKLKIGGTLVSYSPSINQSRQLVEVLGRYEHETFETLLRNWKADRMSPDTQMLGHTGFLTVARRLK